MKIQWLRKEELFPVATKELLSAKSVLDIGCGIHPQEYISPRIHICVEPYSEYIEYLQDHLRYDDRFLFFQTTWEQIILLMPPRSIDTIFLLDVIEHLPKDVGKKLLTLTEKIARKQVVIFTPLGFIEQFHEHSIDAWGMKGGEWQKHKSGWLPNDFDESWKIFASKDFHSTYYKGTIHKKKYGAFWAIKTIPSKSSDVTLYFRTKALLLSVFPKRHPLIMFLRKTKHLLFKKMLKL